jgi:hypothetical protein
MSNRRKLQRKGPREYTMPPAIGALVDAQMLADAAYFRQRPTEQRYTRRAVPGEAWPNVLPPDTVVEVTQLQPGVRRRAFGRALVIADFDKMKEHAA